MVYRVEEKQKLYLNATSATSFKSVHSVEEKQKLYLNNCGYVVCDDDTS